MAYFVFDTEEAAIEAEAAIVANVRRFLEANFPERVSTDPIGLRGYSAATGELRTDGGLTTRWAVPIQCVQGWVIPVPPDIPPMTSLQMIDGIVADTVESFTPIDLGEEF